MLYLLLYLNAEYTLLLKPSDMIIGLTGGIGCGKSTAGKIFRKAGAFVVDTDNIVRDLLDKDESVGQSIAEKLGAKALGKDGKIDRKYIASCVFEDSELLNWLESLLHPKVHQTWKKLTFNSSASVKIVEIPLLFEKNLEKHFDFTVCIYSSFKNQLARLKARGLSESQVTARMSRQWPLPIKAQASDFVILNDGNEAYLEQQIEHLFLKITA